MLRVKMVVQQHRGHGLEEVEEVDEEVEEEVEEEAETKEKKRVQISRPIFGIDWMKV
jgi:hypothetical protein